MTKKQNTQLTAIHVGDYFLSLMDDDAGDTMSNKYLQKLVYLAQGFHLAAYGEPLFNEPIEAWDFGPIVPTLFDYYKKYGPNALPKPIGLNLDLYTKDVRQLLDDIYCIYGQYASWRLRIMLYHEAPWKKQDDDLGKIITTDALQTVFINLIEKLKQKSCNERDF